MRMRISPNSKVDFEKVRLVSLTAKWTLRKTGFMRIRLIGKTERAKLKKRLENREMSRA